jgi:hypothetical protein
MAAGIMAGTASAASASATRPAAHTATPADSCHSWEIDMPHKCGNP